MSAGASLVLLGVTRARAVEVEPSAPSADVAEAEPDAGSTRASAAASVRAPSELAVPRRWTRLHDEVRTPKAPEETSHGRSDTVGPTAPGAGADTEPEAGDIDPVAVALRAARTRVLEFQDLDLDGVLGRLRSLTGLPFSITPDVRASRLGDIRITMPPLDDVSVEWILREVVTRPYGLAFEVREGVVTIFSPAEARLRLRYFDVKDLCPRARGYRGNEIMLAPAGYEAPDLSPAPPSAALAEIDAKTVASPLPSFRSHDLAVAPLVQAPPGLDASVHADDLSPPAASDALIDAIRAFVDPESWTGAASLRVANGTLIVRNAPEIVEHVSQFVAEVRLSRMPLRPSESTRPTYRRLDLWDRTWPIQDLVGRAWDDGTVTPEEDGAPRAPYTPGALLSALRTRVGADVLATEETSIELANGVLVVHLDARSTDVVARFVEELRARSRPPETSATADYEVEIR